MADKSWDEICREYPAPAEGVPDRLATIRARLARARCERLLTQSQAAQLLDMHRPCLSLVESGGQRITVEILLRMAVVYGVAPEWLMACDLDTTWRNTILDGDMVQLRTLGK